MQVADLIGWRKGGFDNVGLLSFSIVNNNAFAVKDFEITCDWEGESGTKLGSSTKTVYQALKAGGKKTVNEFAMGLINNQAERASCELLDVDKAE